MSRTRRILDDNRVFSRAPMGEQSADQHREALAQHIDAPLRELLTYCKTQDGRYMTPQQAYRDVAGKLRTLLDGE